MHLLLVEDYKPLRDSLSKGLRECGYAVDATADGNEGLWYATSNEYDVIVLDLMLPGLDGMSILRMLRKEKKSTNVLILTAKDQVENRIAGLDAGADDYLVKPFAFDELLAHPGPGEAELRQEEPGGAGVRPEDRYSVTSGITGRRGDRAYAAGIFDTGVSGDAGRRDGEPLGYLGARV